MSAIYRRLVLSSHPAARSARRAYHALHNFTLPAPKVIVRPLLWSFLAVRGAYWFLKRILVCEPFFKAYCKSYGRRVRTDIFIHWVEGRGDLVVGDDVKVDGKCGFLFTSRYSDHPTLTIGDHTTIGHNCSFTVGKSISIGRHCLIASNVLMFDTSGHPVDPAQRIAGRPVTPEDVKPIVIGDNVWIGRNSLIFPGVVIGDNSVVSAGSAVLSNVPPNTVVAGYPARRINLQPLTPPAPDAPATAPAGSDPAASDAQPVPSPSPAAIPTP